MMAASCYRGIVLRAITIENFRAFQRFSMEGLGRINLLVGTNNCGKTSVLEAVSILVAWGQPEAIHRALIRRGEHTLLRLSPNMVASEVDIRHLFPGHELELNRSFAIRSADDIGSQSLTVTIEERIPGSPVTGDGSLTYSSDAEYAGPFIPGERGASGPIPMRMNLRWEGTKPLDQVLAVTARGGVRVDVFNRVRMHNEAAPPVQFITTEALSKDDVIAHFESVVLTPDEDLVLQALRTIEPSIERIASTSGEVRGFPVESPRGGLFAKLTGSPQRIPIGSLGDGIWRMLGIALSLAKARGGVLLVDEIDTGLHYSVMADMWRLVRDTAARLDVQVFATTHSRDCYESLAAISRADVGANGDVSIQRIERGKPTAVSFSERDIVIAAERSIEVR